MSGDERKGRRGVTVLRIPGKHALDTHAYALNALDGTPSVSTAEEVQTDYAVRVDVRVHWDVFFVFYKVSGGCACMIGSLSLLSLERGER